MVDEDRAKGTKERMKRRGIIGFIVSESLLFFHLKRVIYYNGAINKMQIQNKKCYWIIGSINKVNRRLDSNYICVCYCILTLCMLFPVCS